MRTNNAHEYMTGWMAMYTQPQELDAIWLESPVKTDKGNVRRIAAGDMVTIRDGKITDNLVHPTHKILRCTGTPYGQFEIAVVELFTNELSQIKLSESCRQIN